MEFMAMMPARPGRAQQQRQHVKNPREMSGVTFSSGVPVVCRLRALSELLLWLLFSLLDWIYILIIGAVYDDIYVAQKVNTVEQCDVSDTVLG